MQHAGAVQSGDAEGRDRAVGPLEHGAMHRGLDLERFVEQRAVRLTHLIVRRPGIEAANRAVEEIAAVFQCQFVSRRADHAVHGVRDAHLLIEGEAYDRQADLRGAVDLEVRTDQMRLVVGEVVRTPGQVRVLQQHRLAARRLRARDGPGVGPVFTNVPIVGDRRVAFAAERRRCDVDKVGQPVRVRDNVDARERQDL